MHRNKGQEARSGPAQQDNDMVRCSHTFTQIQRERLKGGEAQEDHDTFRVTAPNAPFTPGTTTLFVIRDFMVLIYMFKSFFTYKCI